MQPLLREGLISAGKSAFLQLIRCELHDFLDKCSPKFVNNVTIALQRNGWQTLDDMSLDSFNVLYANAKKESETVKPTSMDEVIDQ